MSIKRRNTFHTIETPMEETKRAIILNLLAHHNIMTLATIRPDGFPQAATVYYVNTGFTLYFGTEATSQKAGNIALNNKVSAAIASETENAYKLKALSLSGRATKIADPARAHELQLLLFKAVPAAKRFAPAESNRLFIYSITPVAISLGDYAAGYGKTFLYEFD
ncbi:pyridoxamine 5'-phosphate oxidase family protein [Hyphomicrobium sp.]|uniref:pyridoxamine 5'-phosphate oxidase family protein n=1 Tax=Hyphomicrobium sp. TaxID=82 RepID=UPI002C53E1F0|nr:pyridoxamine 5'-phosphate oxidase family protein [Hyphomicrobium sp.]HVZ03622.1 pyridoxamine 5'-phosphate oxidase family protein [Hyphomicrobium sp.]